MKNKYYYTIGETSKITGLEPHVLRYWETEFSQLNPIRRKSSNRKYTQKDIKLIRKIKYLLYEKKYTIEGAKKRLKSRDKVKIQPDLFSQDKKAIKTLKKIKKELSEIQKSLNNLTS
ncbi:MAG: MerR family transcriptional regulator [Candidatus Cloacimonetes bacterium]|nr:MerR family transcriptional regulator [Candidatus Cloacimonadota bacterium]MBS3767079.1 MerR family transcriptional regulator [Candidatus Cloacimonadota bacterium]